MAIDWPGVRRGFGEGVSAERLAQEYGCSAATIRKKAKKEGWKATSAAAGKAGVEVDHRALLDGVKRRLVKGLENSDIKQGLEELKVAKMAWDVLSDFMKEEKLAQGQGCSVGGEEGEFDEARRLASQMAQVTAAPGADEALD